MRENWLVVLAVVGTAVAGYVLVGLLSADRTILGEDVTGFDEANALVFLGAFGQLVLAVAVWDQIRAGRQTADASSRAARAADESAMSAQRAYELTIAQQRQGLLLADAGLLVDFLARAHAVAEGYSALKPEFVVMANLAQRVKEQAQDDLRGVLNDLNAAARDASLAFIPIAVALGESQPKAVQAARRVRDLLATQREAANRLVSKASQPTDLEVATTMPTAQLEALEELSAGIRTAAFEAPEPEARVAYE